jgi:large subunit ribosomal protein L21e
VICDLAQTGGVRRKTRAAFSKSIRERGIKPLSYLLVKYSPGEKVVIDIDPSVHNGMPFRRFQGKVGVIKEVRGRAYVLEIIDGDKKKLVISRPEHLKPFRGGTIDAKKEDGRD